MQNSKFSFETLERKEWIISAMVILIFITLATSYYGSTDIGDYSDSAQFFAGKYKADIRNSHSYLYGYLHHWLVGIFSSFIVFKITSLIILLAIVYSVYRINNKDKRSLLLMLFAPALWYMAPWINPIQLAGLFLLWAWFFVRKYDESERIRDLIYSGIFVGLGWAVWDSILFFGVFLGIVFLYNKRLWHSWVFAVGVFIGLVPRMLLDFSLFGCPVYTILKSTFGTIANIQGGIYNSVAGHSLLTLSALIFLLLTTPLYYWKMYAGGSRGKNAKTLVFLSLCILLILCNPQIRYIISIAPIMIVLMGKELSEKEYKRQIIASIVIAIIFIAPYVVQINNCYEKRTSGADIEYAYIDGFFSSIGSGEKCMNIAQDVKDAISAHLNETFLVGPGADDYALLARNYWGSDVKEFVSVQDYNAWKSGNDILFEKTFNPKPKINERRRIWITGGMSINEDETDYADIEYALSVRGEQLGVDGFIIAEKYGSIFVWKKVG